MRKNKQNDGYPKGSVVEVRNGDINGAMRRFKRLVQEENIIQEYRSKQEYTKPSDLRKRAKAAARARWLKKLAAQKDN